MLNVRHVEDEPELPMVNDGEIKIIRKSLSFNVPSTSDHVSIIHSLSTGLSSQQSVD